MTAVTQADDHVAAVQRRHQRVPGQGHPAGRHINAVRLVAAGDAIVSPSVTRTLLSHFGNREMSERHRVAAQRLAALTDREREWQTPSVRAPQTPKSPAPSS
ncbi:MAG TPA: hypothetical protein VFI46_07720 [Jiangellaceae bacterium]|nr:hypothetical protein [Jiangellaceae bacterium]